LTFHPTSPRRTSNWMMADLMAFIEVISLDNLLRGAQYYLQSKIPPSPPLYRPGT
jgi:hypothetical protein